MPKKVIKKVYLEDLDFMSEGCHIAYTDGLGAASKLNSPYLLKSLLPESVSQTQEEKGNDNMKKEEVKTEVVKEKTTDIEKMRNELDQSRKEIEEIKKQLAASKRELAVVEISKIVKDFGFDEDLSKSVSNVLVDLTVEQQTVISEAFDCLKAKQVVAVEESENELAKSLQEEVGDTASDDQAVLDIPTAENNLVKAIKAATERMINKK